MKRVSRLAEVLFCIIVGSFVVCSRSVAEHKAVLFDTGTWGDEKAGRSELFRDNTGNLLPAESRKKASNTFTFAFSGQYRRTFRTEELARYLFGGSYATVAGSFWPQEGQELHIMADYLGLPRDFKSRLHFAPVLTDYTFAWDGFLGLDSVLSGLFVGFRIPIRSSRYDIGMDESVIDYGQAFFPAGYMGPERLGGALPEERKQLAPDAATALLGKTISSVSGQRAPLTFGDMQESPLYGHFVGRVDRVGFQDIKLVAGWSYKQDRYHLGFVGATRLPTSNRRDGVIFFEPRLGELRRWALGGGLTGHYTFFKSSDNSRSIGVYWDSLFMHLFSSWERRLCSMRGAGAYNRFMLLQEFVNGAYSGKLVPAGNKTALNAKLDVLIEADITAKLVYVRDTVTVEAGYNFWVNTGERLKDHERFPVERYAYKGDAQIYGFTAQEEPVPLHVVQRAPTISRGQEPGNVSAQQFADNTAFQNLNAHEPTATDFFPLNSQDADDLGLPHDTATHPAHTSKNPFLLDASCIDYQGMSFERELSHRFFIRISKALPVDEQVGVRPSIFVGASVQVAGTEAGKNSDVSRWGINIGGSIFW